MLQIYILPAVIRGGGYIDPDSSGLVAFAAKGGVPEKCPKCGLVFRKEGEYIPATLLDVAGKPLSVIQKNYTSEQEQQALKNELPPTYLCSRCRQEISPYLRLDEVPIVLKAKKKEVLDQLVITENYSRQNHQLPLLTKDEIQKIEDDIPLLIKADDKAFYGRILQVVDMAQDPSCNIKKFIFVTLAEASLEAQKKKDAKKG